MKLVKIKIFLSIFWNSKAGAKLLVCSHKWPRVCHLYFPLHAGHRWWHHQAEDLHLRCHVLHQFFAHGELSEEGGSGLSIHRAVISPPLTFECHFFRNIPHFGAVEGIMAISAVSSLTAGEDSLYCKGIIVPSCAVTKYPQSVPGEEVTLMDVSKGENGLRKTKLGKKAINKNIYV